MAGHTYRNLVKLRPNATDSVLKWIGPVKHCWHLDVWLKRSRTQHLYFHAVTSAGGRVHIGQSTWLVERDIEDNCKLVPIAADWMSADALARDTKLQFGDCQPAKLRAELNRLYWQHIYPLQNLYPQTSFTRRSVAMHCIDRVAGDGDPMAGLPNYYWASGRAERDAQASIRRTLSGLL